MSRVEALKELLAKVEAGEFVAREYPLMRLPQMEMSTFDQIHGAYHGSLDAAKALHDAVLSGYAVEEIREAQGGWIVRLQSHFTPRPQPSGQVIGNPARAWLIAILKALIAQEEGIE